MSLCECEPRRDLRFDKNNQFIDADTMLPIEGIYDHRFFNVRYYYENGHPKHVVSRMWLEDNQANKRLPHAWMLLPWETFPDIPKRYKKK